MIKALQLIFNSGKTWEKISLSRRNVAWVFFLYWLPWLVISTCIEGAGLRQWGDARGQFNNVGDVSMALLQKYLLAEWILLGSLLLVGSLLVMALGAGVHQKFAFTQAFTLVAYGMGPLLMGRVFDAIPQVNTWFAWGLGAVLMTVSLYHGVGIVLRPEITKGFAMYLVSATLLFLLSGLGHFIAVTVLRGGHPL